MNLDQMPIKKYVGFKHFFLFGEQIWKNNKQTKKEEGMSVHVEKKNRRAPEDQNQ